MASDTWCAFPKKWGTPGFIILSIALSSVTESVSTLSPTPDLGEVSNDNVEASDDDDGQCLLQTSTEVKFRAKKVETAASKESQGALPETGIVQDALTMAVDNFDPLNMKPDEDKPDEERLDAVNDSEAESTDMSLLSISRKSHVLGGLIELASKQSATDAENQAWLFIAVIVVAIAIGGTIAVCFSLEATKDVYSEPLTKTPRGSFRPPPPPPRYDPGFATTSDVVERKSSTAGPRAYGTRETLQRELRGAVSLASSSQSPMSTGPMKSAHDSEVARQSFSRQEPLCSSLVVSHSEASYLLPDLSQMTRPVEAFDIVNQSGTCVLGVVVNDGSEDPGILLHAPRTADGAGLPLAFVGTSMALRHAGSLPIARPCVDKKHGEFFANLNRDFQGGSYSVRKDGLAFMRFEGDFVGRSIWLYDKASNTSIGSTRPRGEAFGQIRFELHLSEGKDAALAILCLLAICRLESARLTTRSDSSSGTSLHPDPGAGGGQQGPLFSLGGLQAFK
eukprot:gnl/MRDRNA2_/MRDRNA2_147548_c0_seq1.p1 gnl/MRDRNA2_/MRDRNA2_147548_c0~~gnl/MRDRNA2_/MRDRNA2_147548_c0_seq1.p1  ORF type:complete len:507 (-),score=95.89 gnl/MRDRNA2_/MRDRNA2_147548_c0_seq1:36-1556(-)